MTAAPLTTGMHFKVPFFENVDRIQTSRSVYTLNALDVYTNDNQKVTIDVSIIYQIPSAAVMNLLYHVGRAGNFDIDSTILPVVRDRALAAFAQYNTLTISDQRAQITLQMRKDVSEALRRLFNVETIDVQLTGIHYSPVFDQSIEEAVRAKNLAVQAENTVAQKKFEGQQKTVTALAEAQAAVERAIWRGAGHRPAGGCASKGDCIRGQCPQDQPRLCPLLRHAALERHPAPSRGNRIDTDDRPAYRRCRRSSRGVAVRSAGPCIDGPRCC